jgi:hypothetical protein
MRQRTSAWVALAWIGVGAAACGEDPIAVDPAVARFVGTWDAVAFTVTGDTIVANLLDLGDFWISVEPSGQYTATLEWLGGFAELGTLTVQGPSALTLDPTTGPPAPSTYVFETPDSLVLDGATEFDFNLDGTDEPAQAHIELLRR